jgi:hypothetical protein
MSSKNKFETKDSGQREIMSTGSQRDTQAGKPRYDLIPTTGLTRLADLFARGAVKYDEFNWRKGQPYSRVYASIFRHLLQWASGQRDEDHLAAVAWGVFVLMHFEETDRDEELNDMDKYRS